MAASYFKPIIHGPRQGLEARAFSSGLASFTLKGGAATLMMPFRTAPRGSGADASCRGDRPRQHATKHSFSSARRRGLAGGKGLRNIVGAVDYPIGDGLLFLSEQ
jgi:hypothetical protein